MRLLARAIKQAMIHHEVCRGADQPDAVAGGIDDAIRDDGVVPVTACDGVVARVKPAADDIHVSAPALGSAAEVNSIPAAGERHVADVHIVTYLKENCIIGGVFDRDISN